MTYRPQNLRLEVAALNRYNSWMKILRMALILGLTVPVLQAQSNSAPTSGGQVAAHNPLKVQCDAKPAPANKVSVTCQFTQNAKYGINVVPEPTVEVLAGNTSLLASKIVPANAKPGHDARYYGEMAPVSFTVNRQVGLQARVTYFFCSKQDGFCARKIDKADIRLP